MRFKTVRKTRWVDVVVDGQVRRVEEEYSAKIPAPPRDWDQIATRVGVGLVGGLTMVSIVWSTLAIGGLLGGGVGFAAAAMFDVSWAVCLILEWKARYDPDKRAFPRILGWALLATTMFFIGWHGQLKGDIALAIVGASVSLFAKVLWLGLMRHIDQDISPTHRAWIKHVKSEAAAKLAVAEVKRQVDRTEALAVAGHLALEAARREFDESSVELTAEIVPSNSQDSSMGGTAVEPRGTSPGSRIVPSNSQDSSMGGTSPGTGNVDSSAPSPVGGGSMGGTGGSGASSTDGTGDVGASSTGVPCSLEDSSTANLTADQAVRLLADLIKQGHAITLDQVMKSFNKPKTTASRWLNRAKILADEGTGLYI